MERLATPDCPVTITYPKHGLLAETILRPAYFIEAPNQRFVGLDSTQHELVIPGPSTTTVGGREGRKLFIYSKSGAEVGNEFAVCGETLVLNDPRLQGTVDNINHGAIAASTILAGIAVFYIGRAARRWGRSETRGVDDSYDFSFTHTPTDTSAPTSYPRVRYVDVSDNDGSKGLLRGLWDFAGDILSGPGTGDGGFGGDSGGGGGDTGGGGE